MARAGRHDAASAYPAGQCREAEGDGVPETPGRSQAATEDPALEAGAVINGAENGRIRADSATEAADLGADCPWGLAGLPPEAFVWPVTTARKNGLRGLLGRLRGSNSGEGPEIAQRRPEDAVPINVMPWTWELLPHVSETRDGSPLARLMDRIAWHTALPEDRYILHAERIQARKESLATWGLVRFAAACGGKPSGPPAWLAGERRGDEE